MPEISVIMPVYNVAKYLPYAIKSVLEQTFKDFELILVDDGSTDGSGEICDQFAALDSRIKVLHQTNQGVSVARNRALDTACGKYIGFVDSDDWIEPVMFETMYNSAISSNADIVVCNYREVISDGKIESDNVHHDISEKKAYSGRDALQELLMSPSFCWTKFFKSTCISDIRFQKGIIHAEDLLFIILVSGNMSCLIYIDEKLYAYRARNDSAVRKPFYKEFLSSIIIAEYCVFNVLQREISLKNVCYFRVYRSIYQALGKLENEADRGIHQKSILFLHEKMKQYFWIFLHNPYISIKSKVMICLYVFNPTVYFDMKPKLKKLFYKKNKDG